MTENVKELIIYPVRFENGYIYDAESHVITQIRGWGRLQYLPNGGAKQDAIGEFVAQAINEKLSSKEQKQ